MKSPIRAFAMVLTVLAGLHLPVVVAAPIEVGGVPVELAVRIVNGRFARITTLPVASPDLRIDNPALADMAYPEPVIRLREIEQPVTATSGGLKVTVRPGPLAVVVEGADGTAIQTLTFG